MSQRANTEHFIEARPEEVGLSSTRLQNVNRLIERYLGDGRYPGAISMVARGNRLVHFETYGSMDVEAGKPVAPDTIFRIYSMTKPIASVGLMMLYEQGLFMLDDPVSKFIPALADLKVFAGGTADDHRVRGAAREMTVRDVLMHTSGLISSDDSPLGQLYERAELFGSRSGGTLADMVERLAELPLRCDPGAEWNYGISTDIVGHLAEVISGQPLDRFLEDNLFGPLGMTDTGFSVPEAKVDRFAACYQRAAGSSPRFELYDAPARSRFLGPRTYFSGSGGLVSTASDYLKFCKMLCAGGRLGAADILGPRTVRYMATNHLPNGVDLASMGQPRFSETTMEGIGFGLGFAVLLDPARAQVLGTPGEYYWGGAASTAFFVSPGEDLIMIFLTQLRPSSSYPIRRELRAAIYQSIID